MRKKWSWVVLLAVFALVVAACGDDAAETTTTAAETTTTAAEETTTTAAEETTTTAEETTTTAAAEPLTIGMILVGPQNDRGWSQAHYEAGLYLQEKLGVELIVLDKVNTADRPETTVDQVITQMVDEGADLIFATSDDMRDGAELGAELHPDVPMVWASGDSA
ncbi:MAG TPA: BMP family ABC transporter substrate-binding protein, partial [Acidimicrobiia bacterium]|nr:BMP family ABC transporter substrate-binding protein [Acidimicrobiia bacterium]